MAVINSLGIGAGSKSAGNITYAHYRGRTIAKQRITSNKSNTTLQQAQRERFADVNYLARGFSSILPVFDKTRYGFQLNKFVKLNYDNLSSYIQSHTSWKVGTTPNDAAVQYVTTYLPNVPTRAAAVQLPIFTAYNLRRTFSITVSTESPLKILARFSDPWRNAKKVVLRLVRLLPHPNIPYITDIDMNYGDTDYEAGWSAAYTPIEETINVRPLFAVTILVDDVPSSSFWALQTKYTAAATESEEEEPEQIKVAPASRRRARA